MPASLTAAKLSTRPLAIIAGVVFGVLAVASLALWAYYGTSVFYEMILAGWAACF